MRISILSIARMLNTSLPCQRDLTPEHIIKSINFRIFFVLIKIYHLQKSLLEPQNKPGDVGIKEDRGGNMMYKIKGFPSGRGVP